MARVRSVPRQAQGSRRRDRLHARHRHCLQPAGVPGGDLDRPPRHGEHLREVPHQFLVRRPVHGRSRQADPDGVPVEADDLAARRPGLDPEAEADSFGGGLDWGSTQD